MHVRGPRSRTVARQLAPWLAALACAACSGGDYWLGGGPKPGGEGSNAENPTSSLGDDWLIAGSDPVEIGGEPCRIAANGHSIVSSDDFSGDLWIHDCTFTGLGSAEAPAIDVIVSSPGSVRIERCTFAESGSIRIANADDTTSTLADNLVLADSVVALHASSLSTPAFELWGPSAASKLFQGNRVYRGRVRLASAGWLAGGDTPAESNLVIGLRAGFSLEAPNLVLRGNYVHAEHLASAGDESCLDTAYSVTDALAEHNVLRGGSWVVRGFGGEFRYNALFDPDNLAWVQQPFEDTRLHHNLFSMCTAPRGGSEVQGGVELVNTRAGGIELYNNTFDGGGEALRFGGPAVSIEGGSELASFRSNLVQHFHFTQNVGNAAVRPGAAEGADPPPVRLGYADYNLFDNRGESRFQNYAVAIEGLSVRVDPGFGLFDQTPSGAVDEQVSAELAGATECMPFTDDDLRAGRVTVADILASLRAAYTPTAASPALGSGDPADEHENFIGAVGDGTLASDRFGSSF